VWFRHMVWSLLVPCLQGSATTGSAPSGAFLSFAVVRVCVRKRRICVRDESVCIRDKSVSVRYGVG